MGPIFSEDIYIGKNGDEWFGKNVFFARDKRPGLEKYWMKLLAAAKTRSDGICSRPSGESAEWSGEKAAQSILKFSTDPKDLFTKLQCANSENSKPRWYGFYFYQDVTLALKWNGKTKCPAISEWMVFSVGTKPGNAIILAECFCSVMWIPPKLSYHPSPEERPEFPQFYLLNKPQNYNHRPATSRGKNGFQKFPLQLSGCKQWSRLSVWIGLSYI